MTESEMATWQHDAIRDSVSDETELVEYFDKLNNQARRVPGLVKALEQYMAFVDQYEMPTQEQARHLTETVRAALIDAEVNDD